MIQLIGIKGPAQFAAVRQHQHRDPQTIDRHQLVVCLDVDDDHGFRIDEAEVIYWGTCPDCAAAATA